MRTLALVTDAFGGHGGIAQYNRDFLTALCETPACTEVVALPRLIGDSHRLDPLPKNLTWLRSGLGGKIRYFLALLYLLARDRRFDTIYCGHIHLLPAAALARWLTGAKLILQIYGIDAWQPSHSDLANYLAARVDLCLAISRITRRRFLFWVNLAPHRCRVLPVAVDVAAFAPGPKDPKLLARYGLSQSSIVMTLARLSSQERYKGIDAVLEVLSAVSAEAPTVAYLIVGEGDDRLRLEQKVEALGLKSRVVFAGRVPQEDKAAYYRLADVFAMPSTGEGFGIVFLEAIASGVPVIGGATDGARDALADGALGTLVEPAAREQLQAAIIAALRTKARNPPSPARFAFRNFSRHLNAIWSAHFGGHAETPTGAPGT